MTRKIVALLLALIMLASCGAAVAEDVALSNIKHIHTPFGYTDSNGNDVFDHSQWKTTVSATINQSATISANVYLDGVLFSPMQINGVAGGTATVDAGRVDFAWNGVNTDGWHPNQYAGTQTFVVKITDANGKVLGTKTFDYTFAHDISQHKDHVPVAQEPEYTWYANNTIGLVGLEIRDLDPELTDKWYNIVPIDLTTEGTQVYELVASNMYHIGKAYVTVQDGNVTVEYNLYFGHGYIKDECVAWFNSMDEITTEFLNDPQSDLEFGQPVSIADTLNGADIAILFICNDVTYRQPYSYTGDFLSRYWPNRERWILYREGLTALLDKIAQ